MYMRNFLKLGTETNLAKIFTNVTKRSFFAAHWLYVLQVMSHIFESQLWILEEVYLICWIFILYFFCLDKANANWFNLFLGKFSGLQLMWIIVKSRVKYKKFYLGMKKIYFFSQNTAISRTSKMYLLISPSHLSNLNNPLAK